MFQLENVKADVQRKETDYCALKTQMETLEKQGIDQQRHIAVLKEQIAAKEQQMALVQAEVSLHYCLFMCPSGHGLVM